MSAGYVAHEWFAFVAPDLYSHAVSLASPEPPKVFLYLALAAVGCCLRTGYQIQKVLIVQSTRHALVAEIEF